MALSHNDRISSARLKDFKDNYDAWVLTKLEEITVSGGGTDTTYTLSQEGNVITLTDSNGVAQTITLGDANTTYTISQDGGLVTLTDSNGAEQTITIGDANTTYTLSQDGDTISLTDSNGDVQTITIQGGAPEATSEDIASVLEGLE